MEKKMYALGSLVLVSVAILAACGTASSTPTPAAGMPNPAAVFCEEHGGKVEIITAADGSQSGLCRFPDGSACDEWAYFRGECAPGATPAPQTAPEMANPASVFCEKHGGKLEIVMAVDGSQSGLCRFPDGGACDEWAYFRGECAPKARPAYP